MKTLQAIILATAIGATACGPAATQTTVETKAPVRETVTGVPMGDAQRSVAIYPTYHAVSNYAVGSYTFPLVMEGKATCASYYRDARDDASPIIDAEYDAMVIGEAAKDRRPVTFQHEGLNSNGCYAMTSRPKLVPAQR